jgi:uncharacterized membrane protein
MMQRFSLCPSLLTRGRPTSAVHLAGAAGVIAIATAVRVWNLDGQSFTMDELTDLGVARADGDLAQIIKGAKRFPPLYHIVLRAWLTVFESDHSARWLSVAMGVIAVAAVWCLGRDLLGPKGGFWTAIVMAVSPFHIWYSQETRVYGLFFLLASLALLFLVRAMDSDSWRDWILFAFAAVCGMFTHYYFLLLVALTAVIVIWDRRAWRRLARPLPLYASLLAVGVPWLALLMTDLEAEWGASQGSGFGLSGFGYTIVSLFTGYTVGPSLRELHTMSMKEAVLGLLPWLVAIGICAVVLLANGFKNLLGSPWRWYLFILGVAPVLVVGAASELGPFGYNIRHVVWIFTPVAVYLGSGLARWRSSLLVIVAAMGLLAIFSVALFNRNSVDRYRNEDARAVAEYIESAGLQAPVFVSAEYMAGPVEYYLDNAWGVHPLDDVGRDGNGLQSALVEVSNWTAAGQPFWLAYSRPFHGDPGGILIQELERRAEAARAASFAGFELYRCVSPSPQATVILE